MNYVYGCKNKEHPQVDVAHRMIENPDIRCSVCGEKMHRVPQPFQWYNMPYLTLLDFMDEKHEQAIRKREKRERIKKKRR